MNVSIPSGPSRRDDRFDFMRGIALLIIFIDHVPKNWIEPFTLHAFTLCDAAEMFFFISGYVSALVYGRTLMKQGFVPTMKKTWKRAGVVYRAQMWLLLAVLLLVPLTTFLTGFPYVRELFRVEQVYETPLAYVIPALTLHYQPGYLDILPAYVVFLLAFPFVLVGLKRNVWLVLLPSFVLWLAVQYFGLTLHITTGEGWYFNPFAWQFLFVLGAVFGFPTTPKGWEKIVDSRWLFWPSVVAAVGIAVYQFSVVLNEVVEWVPTFRPETPLLDKHELGFLRVFSFMLLVLLARHLLPASGKLSQHPVAMAVIRCGRHSLQVFTLGVLLSAMAMVPMLLSHDNKIVLTLVAIVGVAIEVYYAVLLERRSEKQRQLKAKLASDAVQVPHEAQPSRRTSP